MSSTSATVYYSALVNPTTLASYETHLKSLIAVSSQGNIDWIVHDVDSSLIQQVLLRNGCPDAQVVDLHEGQFIMPGFIDTHTHAPQVPNLGTGYQYELLDWLEKFTFPLEAKFKDVEFAKAIYPSVVKRFIASGTTTCCYYGSLHLDSSKALADTAHSLGQRALIGKCNMDRHCPSYYIEDSADASVKDTHAFIAHVRSLSPGPSNNPNNPLIYPVLTPRFAISCTRNLLEALQVVATSDPHLHIQTHISENVKEIQFTKELYPECEHYAGVYDRYGLLRNNTILAHAVHLNDKEIELVAKRKAGVSHCPTSNFNLRSGMAQIGKYLDRGVKVGLGTDVSGGFSSSMLVAMRNASIASTVVALQNDPAGASGNEEGKFSNRQLPLATLFYLATKGGAEVCALDHQTGSLEPGKSFDALIVDVRDGAGTSGGTRNPTLWGSSGSILDDMLGQFVFCGDDRNISAVFVQGKQVGGTSYTSKE
ncbi:hypothetical protein GYMLUDRAFT_226708 [Collybiopsis luxurians FD-317 M1]|uniref:Guanine deaminase n=1 Tax=Collybiopsis luxurians FD-317 M1 TaxID=944289 RepID=A0A0D0CBA9_9AGAR|nr:hypothetical protein GYMLUDRAFT_226708 [Collybiopsis luxurians FD-317 M1]